MKKFQIAFKFKEAFSLPFIPTDFGQYYFKHRVYLGSAYNQ